MEGKILEQILKSHKYKNYENMVFYSSYLYSISDKYNVLLPISLYHNEEYVRALYFLGQMNTYTSTFYEYLCYRKIREYKKALNCIKLIVNEKLQHDLFNIEIFSVDENDKEYFYDIMGFLYTQLYDREEALRMYKNAYCIFPVFGSLENLINENELCSKDNILSVKHFNTKNKKTQSHKTANNEIQMTKGVCAFFEISEDSAENSALNLSFIVKDMVHNKKKSYDITVIDKYRSYTPGIGSYVLAMYAKDIFDMGYIEESKMVFSLIKSQDPKFIYNMDYFSTILWHSADITELGILCKNLIIDFPSHPNTWKALGNFYNHKNDYVRSILCFKRSLFIVSDYYTYNLLGFESIHRNEHLDALEYFKKSMLMLKNNYKSRYGCAVVYEKLDKKESAEYYYKNCMCNNQLRVMGIKFYIKNGDLDTALRIYREAMNFSTSDVNKLVRCTLERKGKFDSVQEFLVLEFVEILSRFNLVEFAKNVLNIVEYRGESYYKKREIVYDRKYNLV